MHESLIRALLLFAMCGMCGGVFFAPLILSLRRRRLRDARRPDRVFPDAIVVINAVIGGYVIWSLIWVYAAP